ncbi:related to E3 ubiquitin protein ligase [Cephalotrichum gorgonifer]|uniref:HECT-type E3 ubiquitin transferase n=1 Tax=Cephalotrichum gorgonifer TaxID=2041049 RepID=A0AAE8N547_9PEZI|nr:related to E3 ubiquitin protein ligase [Cephalotrichum gorgonifer]
MSPWPIRKDSYAGIHVTTDSTHTASPDARRPLRGPQFNHDDGSNTSDSELHPPRPSKGMERSGHARSTSTPFPSIFSAGKTARSDSIGERMPPNSDSDSSDDGLLDPRDRPVPHRGRHQRGGHNRPPGKDFTAGNCMTCGSHMRWPRELKTFRCTICLTINDLTPRTTGDAEDGPTGRFRETPPYMGSAGGHLPPPSVKLITCSHTRWLNNMQPEAKIDVTGGLIPDLSAGRFVSVLHAALEGRQPNKHEKAKDKKSLVYSDEWQLRAASRVMAMIFAANNRPTSLDRDSSQSAPLAGDGREYSAQRDGIGARGQIIPTSDFYNSLTDFADVIADFEAWEAKRATFAFCQYPFLLSISSKTEVLEHEARRQMKSKARDAFFDSILNRKNVNQHWVLNVRRDCLVEDSLKGVSEIIGSGSEDIKKSLRITFSGEEGIDHGGLRKEWFLLLVREVFNPDNGMFIYEEDSDYCYFNPHCFETSDQFFLVGVVMGLAIYNSTILDIPLPPFTFRKLLATGPSPPAGSAAHPKPVLSYGIDDLAEIRPQLASGLRQLLEYDGNVEDTFSLDFTISTDKYGTSVQVPLLPKGASQAVTNENRRKYIDLYVRYLLDVSVNRQFEPFKRGFYTVCGGSALTLFRPEEIELLVRGSDEVLDIAALRGVAVYENWGTDSPDDGSEPVVQWFWEAFMRASPSDQRKLLLFITGSDRIPAAGASSLQIKISCLGDDSERFPIARTCFNMLVLWRYSSREKLEGKLWMAAHESEGFGLK